MRSVIKSDERNEDSYIGLADFFLFFFSGKVLTICSRSILIFRSLTCDFFLSAVHFYCYKEGKLHYRPLLVLKMEIIYQITQRNKFFTY